MTNEDNIILGVVTVLIVALMFAAIWFSIGWQQGINHALTESKISVDGNDILIDLDGELYVHYAE